MTKNQIVNAFVKNGLRNISRVDQYGMIGGQKVLGIHAEAISNTPDGVLLKVYNNTHTVLFSFSVDKNQVAAYKEMTIGKGAIAAYRAALPIAHGITAF
jgi:hypothetical protein